MNHLGTSSGSLSSLVAQAADEFLDQLERGEQPDLADFALRYPQIAGVLPQILPALGIFQNAGWADRATAELTKPVPLAIFG